MNELFDSYIPPAWFDDAGLRRNFRSLGMSSTTAKRIRRWKNSAKGASLSVAMSAALALTSVSFTELAAAASNQFDIPVPPGMVQVAPPPKAGASIGEINQSFVDLFAAFRSGTKLITNDATRDLATRAAGRRNDRPEGWARKLASDIKDADD